MAETNGILEGYYFAFVIEKSSSNAPDYEPLYMESAVLVRAASEKAARNKLEQSAGTHSYENEFGETITWTLRKIVEVKSVLYDSLDEITELGARTFTDFDAYEKFESS
ncbi:MAG: DUF4288 domain-containing protein [Myxococcota bacterium]